MNLLNSILQILGTFLGSGLIAWLAILKFKRETRKEEISDDVLGMRDFFEANVKFRDEIRKDYNSIKAQLQIKTDEADLAWSKFRECEYHNNKSEHEIASLKIAHHDLECKFSEFKKMCEEKHK